MPNTVAQINRLALSDTASKLPGIARHHYAGFPKGHDRSASLSLGRITGNSEVGRRMADSGFVLANAVAFTDHVGEYWIGKRYGVYRG
jgi:hypothetical protein